MSLILFPLHYKETLTAGTLFGRPFIDLSLSSSRMYARQLYLDALKPHPIFPFPTKYLYSWYILARMTSFFLLYTRLDRDNDFRNIPRAAKQATLKNRVDVVVSFYVIFCVFRAPLAVSNVGRVFRLGWRNHSKKRDKGGNGLVA